MRGLLAAVPDGSILGMTPAHVLAAAAMTVLLNGCASSPRETAYTGKLFGSKGLLPITTVLWQDARGQTMGRYVFIEPNGRQVMGTLSPCYRQPESTLRCEWQDTYGRGYFYARFTERDRRFSGRWGLGDLLRSYGIQGIWTGER